MKNNSIRSVVATGIGAALFVVIGMIRIVKKSKVQSANQRQFANYCSLDF